VVFSIIILTEAQPLNAAASELSVILIGRLPTNNVEVGSWVPLLTSSSIAKDIQYMICTHHIVHWIRHRMKVTVNVASV